MNPVISKLVTEASQVIIQELSCYQEDSTVKNVCDLTLLPERRLTCCMLVGTVHPSACMSPEERG